MDAEESSWLQREDEQAVEVTHLMDVGHGVRYNKVSTHEMRGAGVYLAKRDDISSVV